MATLADLYAQEPNAGVNQVPLPRQDMSPREKYDYVMAQAQNAQLPAYVSPAARGGIVGPSPHDIKFMLTPDVQGPTPSDIRVVPTPQQAATRAAIARALMHQRMRGNARYMVGVGEPQIAPRYRVQAGAPQIDQGQLAAAVGAQSPRVVVGDPIIGGGAR